MKLKKAAMLIASIRAKIGTKQPLTKLERPLLIVSHLHDGAALAVRLGLV